MKLLKHTLLLGVIIVFCGCNKEAAQKDSKDDGHGHSHDVIGGEKIEIGERAIQNMGAEIKALSKSDFTIYNRIPAQVVDVPTNKITLYAPWGGIVSKLNASISEWKDPDDVVVEISRDPFPRMNLTATANILEVSAEDFHEALTSWRRANSKLTTLNLEKNRLQKIAESASEDLPVIPRKELLELKYKIIQTEEELKAQEHKLTLHGLDAEQISRLKDFASGKAIINPGVAFWVNTLRANGLWQKEQEEFLKILPEKLRTRRWTVQCVAELFSGDYLSRKDLETLKQDKVLLENFTSAAALIQEGYTLKQLSSLASKGFFNDTILLKVPVGSCIEKLRARPGQKVSRGAPLIDLHNPAKMFFEVEAQGSETVDLRQAVEKGLNLVFEPVTSGSSSVYKDLKILSILTSEHEAGHIEALVPVNNKVIAEKESEGKRYQSWDLVQGMRYYARVPVRQLKDVYVLPAEAVLDSGPDKVVLVREGDGFSERKVVVLYSDNRHTVLSNESDIIAGEPAVFKNAFEVLQAVHAGTKQAVDPHQGHSH